MPREAIKVIGDILTHELALASGRIMLTNERYQIPEVNGVYVALSYIGGKAIANNNRWVPAQGGGLDEVQETVMLYQIQIDVMSFDGSARTEKDHVYQALRSVYAEQQMEINTMQVAQMPSAFSDASSLEESKILNRYTMTINVSALLSRTKAVDYYDEFHQPEVHPNA